MSEGMEPQTGVLGAGQPGIPAGTAPGVQMDTQGAVPTDFTGTRASEAEGQMKASQTQELRSRIEGAVRETPWRAVFVGFLLGIAFGRRTRSRMAIMREAYVEPTIDRAENAMFAALLASAAACRNMWRSTSMRTHDAMHTGRIYSKLFAKAAQRMTHRAQRKLHLGRTSFFWK